MRLPKRLAVLTLFALLAFVSGALARPLAVSPSPAVDVTYLHPERFTENRAAPSSERSLIDERLARLKRYIQQRAERTVAHGQHLSIVITDVALAGRYEPWPGSPSGWLRVIRRTYPPRIDLRFTLRDAQGQIIGQGKRTLTNAAFMNSASMQDSDPLRYEKALINRWLRKGTDSL